MSYRGVRKFYHDGNRLLLFNILKIHTECWVSFPTHRKIPCYIKTSVGFYCDLKATQVRVISYCDAYKQMTNVKVKALPQ